MKFSNHFQGIVTPNLVFHKLCRVNLNYSEAVCEPHNVTQNYALAARLQIQASDINIYASVIENLPSILIVLFLGPWSDKNGRKPLMLLPLIGVSIIIIVHNISNNSLLA